MGHLFGAERHLPSVCLGPAYVSLVEAPGTAA